MYECGRGERKLHLRHVLVVSTVFVVLAGCASSARRSTSQPEAPPTQATLSTLAPTTTAAVCDKWTPDWRDRCAEVRESSTAQATPSAQTPPPGPAATYPSTPQTQAPSGAAGLTGNSEVEDSETVPGNHIASGKAPELFTTFCPGCGPGYR
jgi:hypothetical protein